MSEQKIAMNLLEGPVLQELKAALYREVIEPTLIEISQACRDRGIDILTLVDFGSDTEMGGTLTIGETPSATMFLTAIAMQAEGEVDKFMSMLRETITEHNSVALAMLGFPRRKELHTVDALETQLIALHGLANQANLQDAATWLFGHLVDLHNG